MTGRAATSSDGTLATVRSLKGRAICRTSPRFHCAVADDVCNIHIDETGFVLTGPNGEMVVDPDFLQHLLNELIWKTKADSIAGLWGFRGLSFEFPNSAHEYSRIGIKYDFLDRKNYRLTLRGSCAIRGDSECQITLTLFRKSRYRLGSLNSGSPVSAANASRRIPWSKPKRAGSLEERGGCESRQSRLNRACASPNPKWLRSIADQVPADRISLAAS